jgi:hypothetical protein
VNAERILVDTFVWIKYFRDKTAGLSKKVDEILSKHEVYVPLYQPTVDQDNGST